jgi:organic radical activating enzyme
MSTTHSLSPLGRELERTGDGAAPRGHLSEMFCSIQGEGLLVGERQIFVRTAGCAATCSWCDTVYSKVQTPRFVIHSSTHGEPKPWRPNPVSLADVVSDIVEMAKANAPVATVSITGGEPLEQPGFVAALAGALRAKAFRIYLETAGLHADALASLIEHVDVVAADVKLLSATGVDHHAAHRAFLRVLCDGLFNPSRADRRVAFVKVIVDLKATVAEIEAAAALVAECSRALPMVIQPESDALMGRHATREDRAALLALVDAGARAASKHLDVVRVIPQTHKVLHVR